LNRHGVIVPFRVLVDGEVPSLLGCPNPVQPLRSQNAWLSRYSFFRPCSKTRLLEHSSPGVLRPFTVLPEALRLRRSRCLRPDAESNSLGVPCPYSASRKRESTSRPVLPVAQRYRKSSPTLSEPMTSTGHCQAGNLLANPTSSATEPLTGFLNLSAASSSHLRPIIFRWVALMGLRPPGVHPLTKLRQLIAAGLPS